MIMLCSVCIEYNTVQNNSHDIVHDNLYIIVQHACHDIVELTTEQRLAQSCPWMHQNHSGQGSMHLKDKIL